MCPEKLIYRASKVAKNHRVRQLKVDTSLELEESANLSKNQLVARKDVRCGKTQTQYKLLKTLEFALHVADLNELY